LQIKPKEKHKEKIMIKMGIIGYRSCNAGERKTQKITENK
jgi:hypothetical protein